MVDKGSTSRISGKSVSNRINISWWGIKLEFTERRLRMNGLSAKNLFMIAGVLFMVYGIIGKKLLYIFFGLYFISQANKYRKG